MTQKKKNNIIIGSLCAVVLLMAVGYAAFSSILNIKGTSSISSNWKVLITNVDEKNIVGSATNAEEPSWEDLTATFKTNLVSPGDSIEYDITIENRGNLNATLDKITLSDSNNPAIKFTSSGLEEGSELNAGDSAVLTVKVEYDSNVTSQPENAEGTFIVTFDYVQEGKEINTPVKTPANVEIIGIDATNIVGMASVAEVPSYQGLNAKLKTNLTNKDDSLEYNISIQNQGDESAVLTGLLISEDNKVATVTSYGVKEGDILLGNQTALLKVKVAKSSSAPGESVESDLDLDLDYKSENEVTNKTYSVTYDYITNGGGNSNAKNTTLEFGKNVNLNYTAEKKDYDFVGWNIDKDSKKGLTELSVTGKDIILYAIFQEKPLEKPTIEIQKDGTGSSATVTLTYPSGCMNGKKCSYSINGVEQQITVPTLELSITEDTVLIAKTTYNDKEQIIEKKIDFTAPEVSVNTSTTSSSITAVISATDTLSEITKYEFSIDGGEWVNNGANNIYTFTGLDQNTSHTIRVKVTNSSELEKTSVITLTTKTLEVPTYEETDVDNGVKVTITYPEGCGDTLTCSYVKDDGSEVAVNSKTVEVDFGENGTLIGKVSDGINVVSSSYTISVVPTVADTLIEKAVTSGDGLYADEYEEGRYIYKGANPNNYITFNNESWRILSAEPDGTIKLFRNVSIINQPWDSTNVNDWTRPATLNTYLNDTFYNSLNSNDRVKIADSIFSVGAARTENTDEVPSTYRTTSQIVEDEKKILWKGKIALLTLSERIRTYNNVASCDSFIDIGANEDVCAEHSWILKSANSTKGYFWLLSPYSGYEWAENNIYISNLKSIAQDNANYSNFGVIPVLALKSDVTLSGNGTADDPYTINE